MYGLHFSTFQLYQEACEIVFWKEPGNVKPFSENLICAEALLGSEVQGSQLVASKRKESHLSCRDFMCERDLWTEPTSFVPYQIESSC